MSADAYQKDRPIRTGELTEMVLKHFGTSDGKVASKYIGLTQVRAATGYADPSTADVMVMGSWPSSSSELYGFEVKISRSDWLNEVKDPNKCMPTKRYCHQWWLVIADPSFVKDGELPADWGMMVPENGKLKVVTKATQLSPEPLSMMFVASLLRANAKETIPVDVHNDKLKDAVRDAETAMKLKYGLLMDYVKFLNKEFGISLKKSDWSDEWHAVIDKKYKTLSKGQLVGLFHAALAQDLEDLAYKFTSMRKTAADVIELADKLEI